MKRNNKNKKYEINPLFILLVLSFIPLYVLEYGLVIIGFQVSFLIGISLSLCFVFADMGFLLVPLMIRFV